MNMTKATFGYTLIFTIFTIFSTYSQIPAFPGAEGYGKYTVGGRGGQVIRVTNLNDSGPGSFRAACEASGPRTVIFDVGGRIDITGPTIKITNPYITIAGQSAPGGGIMLTRETVDRPILEIDTDEVIIRYIRFRRSTTYRSGNNADNVWVNSGNNIIFDHCSLAWSSDGNLDIANYNGQPGRPPQVELSNITIQYCIFTNSYGGSNKTFLVSRGPTNISWFRNAWLSTATRNPSVSTPVNEAPTWDCYYEHVNNFHYDYTNGPSYNNNDPSIDAGIYYVNVVKNWAKENGTPSPTIANYPISSRRWLRASTVGNGMDIFVEDNITPYRPNDSYGQWEIGQNGGGQANNHVLIPENLRSYTVNDTPILSENVTLWDATDIWDNLRDHVGASLPERDSEDARAVNDVDTGDSTENKVTNVFPIISNGTPFEDSDNDGMPDFWEITEYGNTSTGNNDDTDGDGYTNLEEFLNQTANGMIPDVPVQNVEITPETATINIPETISLTKNFTPANTTNKSGIWTSGDDSIATVSSNGTVTPITPGVVTITFVANDGGFTDSSEITITNFTIDVESIDVTPDNLNLDIYQTTQLTVNFLPENATDHSGVWTSNDESVVTVDADGNITGVSEGVGEVTFTSNDGNFSDTSIVTVVDVMFGTYDFYNADTDIVIQQITENTTFDLDVIGNQVNFISTPQGGNENPEVESVEVNWTGVETGSHTESYAIYAGMATHNDTDIFPYTVIPGTYNFTVNYYDEDNAEGLLVASDNFSITFTTNAVLTADAGDDQSICQGENVTLTATGGSLFEWNTGETTASINVSPTETTTYTVTVSNGGVEELTDSVTITVNDTPSITVSGNVTIGEGESTTISVSGADTYLWDNGSTEASLNVSPAETTVYTVTGFSGDCESEEAQVTVTVFKAEAGEDERVCENDNYQVELTANQGDSYLWSTGETTQSILVSPLSTTNYSVAVTLGTYEDTDDVTVFVDPNPNVVIANGDSVDILDGDFITISASGANNYEWSNGATQPNIAVSPSQTTTYEVRGYINDCYDDKNIVVNVYEPVSAYAGEDAIICIEDSIELTATGGDEYLWSTGETSATITVAPTETTDYYVTVFNAIDFDEASVRVEVDIDCNEEPIDPNEGDLDYDITLYPNPANDVVNIKLTGSSETSVIKFYDITGKLILKKEVTNQFYNPSITAEVNVNSFQPGIYLVKLEDGTNKITKRLIVN